MQSECGSGASKPTTSIEHPTSGYNDKHQQPRPNEWLIHAFEKSLHKYMKRYIRVTHSTHIFLKFGVYTCPSSRYTTISETGDNMEYSFKYIFHNEWLKQTRLTMHVSQGC